MMLLFARAVSAYVYPWQDPTLPVGERVDNLISLLTLDEKVSLLSAAAPAVPRIELPAYQWAHECERGDTNGRTAFPSGIALGTSFNATLVQLVAHATAIEVRAGYSINASGHGGASCFGPVTNLIRDPRWGRANEMLGGEDTT